MRMGVKSSILQGSRGRILTYIRHKIRYVMGFRCKLIGILLLLQRLMILLRETRATGVLRIVECINRANRASQQCRAVVM